jgi:hypothetical protein
MKVSRALRYGYSGERREIWKVSGKKRERYLLTMLQG